MDKFLIITTINPPTDAIKTFSLLENWKIVVVGDKKTPEDWSINNVIYLGIDEQDKYDFFLPFNNYVRKMIGYVYAIQNGAEIIAETDDDNFPQKNWNDPFRDGEISINLCTNKGFANIYKLYSNELVWPRGLPLTSIYDKIIKVRKHLSGSKIGVWQGLVNNDPDIDAIHRLVFNKKKINFLDNCPTVLNKGAICPFNSQNTFFRKELFPLLYLPVTVNSRFCDLLRSLIAQPIMWKAGYYLGFLSANAYQVRNEHNLIKDFEDEIPCYLLSERVLKIVKKAIKDTDYIEDSLYKAYMALVIAGIVKGDELNYLNNWLNILKENKKPISIIIDEWQEVVEEEWKENTIQQ